eukprot:COSAG02_NODE_52917_length_305_cov_0.660194_1_plen_80_part_10
MHRARSASGARARRWRATHATATCVMLRLEWVSRLIIAGTAAEQFGSTESVEQYRALGLEWAPVERLPPPTTDVRSADAF